MPSDSIDTVNTSSPEFNRAGRSIGTVTRVITRHGVAPTLRADQTIIVNLSGRGDKDLHTLLKAAPERFQAARGAKGDR